jgi:hypothetical protein
VLGGWFVGPSNRFLSVRWSLTKQRDHDYSDNEKTESDSLLQTSTPKLSPKHWSKRRRQLLRHGTPPTPPPARLPQLQIVPPTSRTLPVASHPPAADPLSPPSISSVPIAAMDPDAARRQMRAARLGSLRASVFASLHAHARAACLISILMFPSDAFVRPTSRLMFSPSWPPARCRLHPGSLAVGPQFDGDAHWHGGEANCSA